MRQPEKNQILFVQFPHFLAIAYRGLMFGALKKGILGRMKNRL